LALSYILSYNEISTVITGIRTAPQAEINSAGLRKLEKNDMELIERLGRTDFVELMKIIKQQETK
jgi:aryl-alcohol dehydrogenase-like predicted oxidoreductase